MKLCLIWIATIIALLTPGQRALAIAQSTTTGEVYGGVIDRDSRQPLPAASVRLLNLRNGRSRPAVTDSRGNYVFALIAPGSYSLRAEKAGYVGLEYPRIVVPLNQPKLVIPVFALSRIDSTVLGPSGAQSAVRVKPAVFSLAEAQIPTASPAGLGLTSMVSLRDWALRSNFDSSLVPVLPLRGGRTFDQLALLAPGVARAPFSSGEGPAVGIGVGSIGQFAVNGLRSRSNNFTVDGSDNNDEDIGVRRQGFVALVPQSSESIEEFQIMTAGFPASFGRNAGSMVNAISRSGENTVHGAVYGFFNNAALNARNIFDSEFTDSVNKETLNGGRYSDEDATFSQYGGVIGGPMVANRLFYFASQEVERSHGTALQHFVVPTKSERGLRTRAGVVPIEELGNFFRSRLIPYSSGAGESILSLYPLPNNAGGPFQEHNYSQAGAFGANSRAFSAKVDGQTSEVHSFAGRYNFTQDESRIPFTGEAINSAVGTRSRIQNLSLFVNSAAASWGNAFHASYGRTRLAFPPEEGSPLLFGSSPAGVQPDLVREVQTRFGHFGPFGVSGPIGQLSILPYSTIGVDVYNFPQGRVSNTYQLSDFVTRIGDTHVIKAGFDIRHSQLNSFADRNSRPLMIFGYGSVGSTCLQNPFCPFATEDGTLHGVDLAALGAPSGFLQTLSTDPSADTTIGLRVTQYDFFAQDDWKLTKSLTVNLGIRYELQTVPREMNDRIEKTLRLTPDQFGHLDPAGSDQDQQNIRAGNFAFDQALEGWQQAVAGRTGIYAADRNNFAPRIGFAWDPIGDGRTAVHAGFSIQFDANPGAFTSQSRNVFPTFIPVNLDLNFNRPNGILLNNPTFFNFLPTQTPLVRPGTLNVYNLTGDAFATGLGTLFSQQPPNPTATLSSNGLAFTLPAKDLRTASGKHFLFSAEHQFGDNWMASAAYVGTQGRHLPRFTTPNGGLISSPVLLSSQNLPIAILDQPPYGGRPAASLGAFTIMENSASSSYHSLQLGVLKRLSRGFQFRWNWTWSHGIDDVSDMFDSRGFFALPEDSLIPEKDRASSNFDVRHRVAGFVTWTGFHHLSLALTAELQTGPPYSANTAVDLNHDGNLTDRRGIGRNTLRVAGIHTIDAAVSRSFPIGASRALDARIEAFNIFNQTIPGIPVRVIESPGFGTSFDTQVKSRSARVSAKLTF